MHCTCRSPAVSTVRSFYLVSMLCKIKERCGYLPGTLETGVQGAQSSKLSILGGIKAGIQSASKGCEGLIAPSALLQTFLRPSLQRTPNVITSGAMYSTKIETKIIQK